MAHPVPQHTDENQQSRVSRILFPKGSSGPFSCRGVKESKREGEREPSRSGPTRCHSLTHARARDQPSTDSSSALTT